jgi:RNA polymerase sigma factor (sigma-70 family)
MEGSSYEIFDKAIKMVIAKYRGRPFYDDLYQDAYCKIMEVLKNNQYEPILNLFGYAYRIARNQVSYYMYHKKKLTTIKDDMIFENIIADDYAMDFTPELMELASEIIKQFDNVLEVDFTEEDLLELIHKDDADISSLKYRIIKGEFLWRVSRN